MDETHNDRTIAGLKDGLLLFGRYRLVRLLGQGGMGMVWEADDLDLDRRVALKFLPTIVAMDEDSMADLKREARRSLELTHPNIVRVHDLVRDQQMAAISMEFVNGATLSRLKNAHPQRCFEVGDLQGIVRQLGEAMSYAHERARIVHRDIKPSNLMLTTDGELKITDFGISATLNDSTTRISRHAVSGGTLAYASPQQMRGRKASESDDVYAIGATLYDLLTGRPPFYQGNIMLQLEQEKAPSLTERRRELEIAGQPVPPDWEEAIAACLSKEPEQRPGSVRELSQRLLSGPAAESRFPASCQQESSDRTLRAIPSAASDSLLASRFGKLHAQLHLSCAVLMLGLLVMELDKMADSDGLAILGGIVVLVLGTITASAVLAAKSRPSNPWFFRFLHGLVHTLVGLVGLIIFQSTVTDPPYDWLIPLISGWAILSLSCFGYFSLLHWIRGPRLSASFNRIIKTCSLILFLAAFLPLLLSAL